MKHKERAEYESRRARIGKTTEKKDKEEVGAYQTTMATHTVIFS